MNRILPAGIAVLIILNLICFCLMAWDKHCARAGKWRIPEKTLFLSAACFGALGGILGMKLCRHKTKHASFRFGFPLLLIVQCALIAAAVFMLQ